MAYEDYYVGIPNKVAHSISQHSVADKDLLIDCSTKQEQMIITGYQWTVSPYVQTSDINFHFNQWAYLVLGISAEEIRRTAFVTAPPQIENSRFEFLILDTLDSWNGKTISYTPIDVKKVPPGTKACLVVPAPDFKTADVSDKILTTFLLSTIDSEVEARKYFGKYGSV